MKRVLFSAIAVSILLLSCSKKNDNAGPKPPVTIKGKKLVFSDLNYPTNFTYNANGSLKELSFPAWGYDYKYSFGYSADSVNYVAMNTSTGKKSEIGTYWITNGKATGISWWTCNAGGEPIWNYNDGIFYNAGGLVEKHTYEGGVYSLFYYDGNGDLVKKDYIDEHGTITATSVFTYYDKEDKFPWFGPLDAWFQSFFITPLAKHLLKKRVHTDLVDPSNTGEINYAYEFDADGYVIKGTAQYVNTQQTTTYEWHNTFQ